MTLPTEPIGSIPRPQALIDGMGAASAGTISPTQLDALYDDAVTDTLRRFEATGSPVVTDGEQRKQSFATYPVAGLPGLSVPCGFDAAGLPVGLQLIAPWFSEEIALRVGDAYQRETDWHRRRPSLPAANDTQARPHTSSATGTNFEAL